jgi:hypothetical protein
MVFISQTFPNAKHVHQQSPLVHPVIIILALHASPLPFYRITHVSVAMHLDNHAKHAAKPSA